MSRGPVASQLVLLSDLRSRSIGDKVRFLGWYDCLISLLPPMAFYLKHTSHTLI